MLRIESEVGQVFRVDQRTGQREQLVEPRIGGWSEKRLESMPPQNPPQTIEQIDAVLPIPDEPMVEQIGSDGRGDLAARLLAEFGGQLWPFCHVSSPLWVFEGMMTQILDALELIIHACQRLLAIGTAVGPDPRGWGGCHLAGRDQEELYNRYRVCRCARAGPLRGPWQP